MPGNLREKEAAETLKTIYFEKDIPRVLATKFAAKHCKSMLYGGLNAVKFKTGLPDPPLPAGD